MATTRPLTLLTPRDSDLFLALDRSPLTVRQLLKLSATFSYPFTSERRVQERLARLCAAGRVRPWQYATAGRGALSYYTLSLEGYRLLYGHDAPLPQSHAFSPVGIARQGHTRALADFLVHTLVGASRLGVSVTDFRRENALRLEMDGDSLYPDSTFTLRRGDRFPFHYFVELDNVSQRLHSGVTLDSWERKIRFYDAYQERVLPRRFHVLIITTGTPQRLQHILDAAKKTMCNPQRSLVYGITLSRYLDQAEALTAPCFRDNTGRSVVLVLPSRDVQAARPQAVSSPLAEVAAVCYRAPPAVAFFTRCEGAGPRSLLSPP